MRFFLMEEMACGNKETTLGPCEDSCNIGARIVSACVYKLKQYQKRCERNSTWQVPQWHGCMNHCCCTVYKALSSGWYTLRRHGCCPNQCVVWLDKQGILHRAGATHVRLGPSFEVLIRVPSYLRDKDQKFGSSPVVFFLSFSVVRKLCRDRVLWRD